MTCQVAWLKLDIGVLYLFLGDAGGAQGKMTNAAKNTFAVQNFIQHQPNIFTKMSWHPS